MFLKPAPGEEIEEIIDDLCTKNARGFDNIAVKSLKKFQSELSPLLEKLIHILFNSAKLQIENCKNNISSHKW